VRASSRDPSRLGMPIHSIGRASDDVEPGALLWEEAIACILRAEYL